MNAAIAHPPEGVRAKAAAYRPAILLLLQKQLSHRRIAQFLRVQGVEINQTAVSRYLRTHPPTEAELEHARIKLREEELPLQSAQDKGETRSRGLTLETPPRKAAERSAVTDAKENGSSDSEATVSAQAMQKPSASKRRHRPADTDDGIDYSFLNVEGRPFTIKPKQPQR